MGLLSNKIRREQLNPGDHIYTWRNGYSYSHHGIYVGDGKVIHLTRAPGLLIYSSSHEASPSHPSGEDPVMCCSIEEFLSGGDLCLYEYGVKTALFLIKRGGTCTPITGDPPEDVLHRASILLERGFGDYHLFQNNCEDFAMYCKTGLLKVDMSRVGRSGQINFLSTTYFVVSLTPYHLIPSGFISLALVVYGLVYWFFRMSGDRAVQRVPVEEFDLNYLRTIRMENDSRRRYFFPWYYVAMAMWVFNYWSWTPACRILLWSRLFNLYIILHAIIFDHLKNYRMNLNIGEYVAWIIWVLGYWYWSSESSGIYFWSKVGFLYTFLLMFVPDPPRRLKLEKYVAQTTIILGFWFWSPERTILLWVRLFYINVMLFMFVPDHLRNPGSKLSTFFVACFVIQSSVLLFLRLDLEYSFRIAKSMFYCAGCLCPYHCYKLLSLLY